MNRGWERKQIQVFPSQNMLQNKKKYLKLQTETGMKMTPGFNVSHLSTKSFIFGAVFWGSCKKKSSPLKTPLPLNVSTLDSVRNCDGLGGRLSSSLLFKTTKPPPPQQTPPSSRACKPSGFLQRKKEQKPWYNFDGSAF